mmetsp:Transcript_5366/g.7366  ORF Transcript_5366/g.7366 Transcript_5366/m.7366 type:complete len:246 (-) Transcript_5366:100-837(-)|eukprot:CAMPEP_0185724670 /NCGR_PEP_ID=MMETSP1171-20130828/1084_1 /TAXON_ID=374046 /ORGANISM="Helicotheca tamensis, Strain CCMP826" /LENGTH=245 /DNA_ID=CAMNT_0028392575 /DNA_START=134 /DNA_END=871 /DNA_ORIENTATION=-
MKFPYYSSSSKLNQYILSEDWFAVKARCEKHPREASAWSNRVGFFDGEHASKVLPLHQACALHAPKDVIEAIISAYPQGVSSVETGFKRLPIHVACQHSCSADVIQLLLVSDPSGTSAADIFGRYPIHYACSNGAPLDVLEELFRVDPNVATYYDLRHWLPIHVACHMGVSTDAVRKLLDGHPASVAARTDKGSTPMKLISKISCKNKDEIIAVLEEALARRKYPPSSSVLSPAIPPPRVLTYAA